MTIDSNLTNTPSKASSGVARLINTMVDGFANYIQSASDHMDIASQMTTKNGSSQLITRREYRWQNLCSGAWADLYGNTTDVNLPADKVEKGDTRTLFCARLNLAYWENRRAQFYDSTPILNEQGEFVGYRGHPECDPRSSVYDEMAAINNIEHTNLLASLEEAKANHAECLAYFSWTKSVYEELTGKAFVYQPYTNRSSAKTPSEGNRLVGLAALKRARAG